MNGDNMGIKTFGDGGFVATGDGIPLMRLATLKAGLKLEIVGMRVSRGSTCYSILKNQYGLKGNRQRVLEQVEDMIRGVNA